MKRVKVRVQIPHMSEAWRLQRSGLGAAWREVSQCPASTGVRTPLGGLSGMEVGIPPPGIYSRWGPWCLDCNRVSKGCHLERWL